LSNIIKARSDQPPRVSPFGFIELVREHKSRSSRNTGLFAGVPETPDKPGTTREVQTTAEELRLNAERKAQEMEEQAYHEGYEQGQKDGYEFGKRSMAIVKEHLEKLFGELQDTPETIVHEYRDWLIEMCLTISRHIVRRELSVDNTQLAERIDTLLREAAAEHTLTVNVHPDDLRLLEEHLDLKDLAERSGRTFTLRSDSRIERGGCRLDSEIQVLDATIEKQFSFIQQALKNDESISDQISI
jgi:flagellar assembly protein FliH